MLIVTVYHEIYICEITMVVRRCCANIRVPSNFALCFTTYRTVARSTFTLIRSHGSRIDPTFANCCALHRIKVVDFSIPD